MPRFLSPCRLRAPAPAPFSGVFAVTALLAFHPAIARAAVYFVDRGNPACSDAGPGSSATPFCTITAGVARGGPGVTLFVKPGVYRERIVIPTSGAPNQPFLIEAITSRGPVVVDGADDFGALDKWAPHSGDVWLARSVTVAPRQVFVDDARLTASALAPEWLTPSTFRHVAGVGLFANVGGGSPGARRTFVGARTNGFRVTGRSWVEIRNFDVTRADEKGIYVLSGAQFVRIFDNRVSRCASNGISVQASSDVTIEANRTWENGDHGISLLNGVTRTVIRANESFRNARPTVRAATGFYLFNCSDNRLEGNRAHHNQDSGFEFADTSHRNVSLQNLSWSNGDHGYDHVRSIDNVHVGDVAWGNFKDGFSIEGASTGTRLHDCIAAQNGITSNEFNLYVDPPSMPGFVSDDNVFWAAVPRIKVNGVNYPNLAAYSTATGLDRRSYEVDPRFVDPANGDFALQPGSRAIDSGNSSAPFWPATDALGRPRIDVVAVADSGTGPVTYADRGALEYVPPAMPPTLVVPTSVTLAEGGTLSITLQATVPTGQPVLYLGADLTGLPQGNDAVFTPAADLASATLVWHPTYNDSGVHRVTFIASSPATSTATTTIRVTNQDRAPILTVTPGSVEATAGSLVRFDVRASDPDGDPIHSLTADMNHIPAGSGATFTTDSALTSGTFSWTPATTEGRKNFRVTFTARNARSTSVDATIKLRARGALDAALAGATPATFAFAGPLPNPARGVASFSVAMPRAGRIAWDVVDLQGRTLWSATEALEAGVHGLVWRGVSTRGGAAAPGVYFARVRSPFAPVPRTIRFLYLRSR